MDLLANAKPENLHPDLQRQMLMVSARKRVSESDEWENVVFTRTREISPKVWGQLSRDGFSSSMFKGRTCGWIVRRFTQLAETHPDMLSPEKLNQYVTAFTTYGQSVILKKYDDEVTELLKMKGRTHRKYNEYALYWMASEVRRLKMMQNLQWRYLVLEKGI
jgi:hypothetical protein